MDDNEMRKWNASRRELFDVELPAEVQARIDARIAQLDYERAMKALAVYRAEKPYKGFYVARFNYHYQIVASAETDRAASRPAALPQQLNDYDAERAERIEYARIPDTFIADCRRWFEGWGWPEGSRGWMILCIDAYAGREVDQYRCHPPVGSGQWERERRIKAYADQMDRNRLLGQVTRLQSLCREAGVDDERITETGFSGLERGTGAQRPGDAARARMRSSLAHGMAAAVAVGAARKRPDDADPVHPLDRCV